MGHRFFCLIDGVRAEMEDRGGEDGAGMAFFYAVDEVLEISYPAGCDDGHGNGIRDRAVEFEIEA